MRELVAPVPKNKFPRKKKLSDEASINTRTKVQFSAVVFNLVLFKADCSHGHIYFVAFSIHMHTFWTFFGKLVASVLGKKNCQRRHAFIHTNMHKTQLSFFLSFFLSWVAKTQPHHWTKRVVSTRLTTDPEQRTGADLVFPRPSFPTKETVPDRRTGADLVLRPTLLVGKTTHG